MLKKSFNSKKKKVNKNLEYEINPKKEALKISIIYSLLGVAWIKISDLLLERLTKDSRTYWTIQTYKGWIYVLIATYVMYLLLKKRILLLKKTFVELNESNSKLNILAHYDTLTSLPNSSFFKFKVNELIDKESKKNEKFAILYIDIDDFRNINNTLGHKLGDRLISYIANILKYQIRDCDFVARFGGDEFTILLTDIEDNKEVINEIERIIKVLRTPLMLANQVFYISYSIGIAIYREHGKDSNELLKNANTAMFEVKNKGKNGYVFYDSSMEIRITEKVKLINEMKHAIDNNEFMLYYQPIISLKDNKLFGFEALIRWYHPKKGFIPPMSFIPLSESIGYIEQISRWVLETSFKQINKWKESGIGNLVVGINISGKLLINDDIVNYIKKLLDLYKINSKSIKLEITETAVMADLKESVEVLKKLKAIGVQISLDDFGTGYSSLTYLKRLPMNMVKLDKEFINNIFLSNQDKIVVEYVIKLIKELNLKIVAEGIETEEQLTFLKNNQCDFGQGYYFSRPIPKEECENLIKKFNTT